jgi:hypothetical protein
MHVTKMKVVLPGTLGWDDGLGAITMTLVVEGICDSCHKPTLVKEQRFMTNGPFQEEVRSGAITAWGQLCTKSHACTRCGALFELSRDEARVARDLCNMLDKAVWVACQPLVPQLMSA